MIKILTTGSCGFIFSNFIRKVIFDQNQKKPEDRKYNFVSLDMLANTNANTMYINKNHIFYLADIRDAHIIDKIFQFEKPDIVIHGAAESAVDKSINDPNSFITSNVVGTQNIINACVKYKTERLVYVSSDEVLGELKSETEPSWTEDAPLNPRNPYSASKAAGELLVKAAHHAHGLNYNITRCSNVYGPRQLPEKLIPRVIKCILNNEKIPIYGEGKQIRDWTHVSDKTSAIMTILENGLPNEIYNISANQEFTNLEVVYEICKYMGRGEELISFIPDPRGNAHDFRYSVDSSKLRNLGWKPQMNFKRDLGEHCVKWYATDNQWWFK